MNALTDNLPNVIVLTFPKTGSTSLYHTFSQHPDICLPNSKETWFFDQFWNRGIEWYKDKFSHCSIKKIRCDFVSTLMYEEGFTGKLKQAVPEARFIVLLRDPVERCISHYFHEIRRELESEDFETALARERKRIQTEPQKYTHIAYRDIGRLYKSRICELLDNFPREKIFFVLLEEFTFSPNFLRKLWDFLQVESVVEEFSRKNVARLSRNRLVETICCLPENIYCTIQNSLLLQAIVPKAIKQKTRTIRSKIVAPLVQVTELAYEKVDKPAISEKTRIELGAFYCEHLKGLDTIIGKDLKTYWQWYKY